MKTQKFQARAISDTHPDVFGQLDASTLRKLDPNAIRQLSPKALDSIGPNRVGQLRASQLRWLSGFVEL